MTKNVTSDKVTLTVTLSEVAVVLWLQVESSIGSIVFAKRTTIQIFRSFTL